MKPCIDHLNRFVSNVDRFIDFYCNVLSYELIDRGKKANGMSFAILKGFSHEMFISETESFTPTDKNFRHIGYTVDNVDEFLSNLKFQGYVDNEVKITIKKFSRQFYIKDPDGFKIDLIQWTDKFGFYESLM